MAYQLSLPLLDEHIKDAPAGELLKKAKTQLGFIPNLYKVMANLPELLETYRFGDTQFRQAGFTAIEQEVVYLTISTDNECDYCMAAHSVIATKQAHAPQDVIDAIRQGKAISDTKLQALSSFTRLIVTQRGLVTEKDANVFLAAGFTEHHILAVILAVGLKTMSNYTNHLARTPIDAAFVGRKHN